MDGFFAVSYLVTSVLLFISDLSTGHRAIAIGALTLIVPWYAAFGRRAMIGRTGRRRNLVFGIGVVLLFCVPTIFGFVGFFALFALAPMLLMTLPMSWAVSLLAVANLFPVAMVWVRGEEPGASVWGVLPIALLSLALSVLLGVWIKRMSRQSQERARLIEELRRSRERVARLSHEAGISAERERLARGEIHDTLAQSLTSIISLLQPCPMRRSRRPGTCHGPGRWPGSHWRRPAGSWRRGPRPPCASTHWPRLCAGRPTAWWPRPASTCAPPSKAPSGRCPPPQASCCCAPPRRPSRTYANTPRTPAPWTS
ncbi:two-component system, sensor protein [[Actinomadura] parvosata subsp. kistnae]|nr:two-component system, sensor protein [Actinomadura parvosata subsp. kistnae]